MGFLNSWPLWTGLAAVGIAVPVIIHLLYRKHRRQTDWAAMELLRRALVIRSGQVRLEDYLILFLRCLALLLIAAALLRPTLNSDSVEWLGEKRVGMVVAIDSSFSMNHGEFSRFEKAIQKAKQILETADQGEPVSLVLMSNRPQILLRRTGYDPAMFDDLLEQQKTAAPYRLSLEPNLEQLEELVAELKTPARECYLVTDGQEMDWGELADHTKETLTRLAEMANVFVVPVDIDGEDNLSLTGLSYASGSLQKSGTARFLADVRNEGRRATDGGNVEFYVGDELIARAAVGALEPGETNAVSFFTSFENEGDVRLRARLTKDELMDDNDRFAVVRVRPTIRVLCIDDESTDGNGRTGAYYAVRALRLLGRDAEGPMQVNQVKLADLSLENLSEYDVLLIANVPDVAPEMVQRIERFVREGGGLILFLGNKVDADQYNRNLGELLPGELGETLRTKDGESGWSLAPTRSDHPLAAIVQRLPDSLADTARFSRIVQTTPAAGSQTILSITQQGAPLLLTRDLDAGSVLLCTTSGDRSWTELPVHPLYAMLLQQAVTNMTSRPETHKLTVGDLAELPVHGREVGDRLQLRDPRGKQVDLQTTESGQQPVCTVETAEVGVYEIAGDQGSPLLTVAANVDGSESNVRVVDAAALAETLEPLGIEVATQKKKLATVIENRRQGRELASLLLISGIVFFVLQSLLAKYFTNRMSQPDTDVAASLQMSRVTAARRL